MKRALIIGVSGQDGSYLARLLLEKGYEVHGTSRDHENHSFANHANLQIKEQIHYHTLSLTEFASILTLIENVAPDEIYHLSGQTSVGLSFSNPVDTFESIALGTQNLLECLRLLSSKTRFFYAGSSEVFGTTEALTDESTQIRPNSPYATAKAAAQFSVRNYREAYGLHCSTGILFNHESPLRPKRFVTQKIVQGAFDIKDGKVDKIELGRLDVSRDWGWAPEYVEAMWLMLQQNDPDDFVIATGETHSLQDFLQHVFESLQLDWRAHSVFKPTLVRPLDISWNCGNSGKAERKLGWRARTKFEGVIEKLVKAEATRRQ